MDADPDLRAITGRYGEFRLCREMGWTLTELYAQPAEFIRDCYTWMAAEGDAKARLQQRAEAGARGGGG